MNEIIKQQHEAIKSVMDIVEVVGHFECLHKKGVNYKCKCLFHDEKTASFSVSAAKQMYKCFGCGVGGDAIRFIREHLKLSYNDAMKWLGDFYHMPIDESTPRTYTQPIVPPRPKNTIAPRQFIPKDIFNNTLTGYSDNGFIKWLHTLFEPCVIDMLIEKYFIGTSSYYVGKPDYKNLTDLYIGGVVFWQVDNAGNIRYGKIMGYNIETGKRIKQPDDHINTIHKHHIRDANQRTKETPPAWATVYDQQDSKPQALFGQHLLSEYPAAPVALVESEKTAIIASVFLPQFIWLAVGGKVYEKFNKDKSIRIVPDTLRARLKPLTGRNVVLFPDCDALDDWQELSRQCAEIANFTVNDLLKRSISLYSLPEKADLCDYLTSEAARRELIDEFKQALINNIQDTPESQQEIWEQCRAMGLRIKDRQQAGRELIDSNIFSIDSNEQNSIVA